MGKGCVVSAWGVGCVVYVWGKVVLFKRLYGEGLCCLCMGKVVLFMCTCKLEHVALCAE